MYTQQCSIYNKNTANTRHLTLKDSNTSLQFLNFTFISTHYNYEVLHLLSFAGSPFILIAIYLIK